MNNILIATPTYKNSVSTWYLRSMMRYSIVPNLKYSIEFIDGDSLVTRARNLLFTRYVDSYMNNEYSHLFWQDDDIFVSPDQLKNLIDLNVDVIGAAYPLKTSYVDYGIECVTAGVYEEVKPMTYKCKFLGTGALLMSKKSVSAIVDYCVDNNLLYKQQGRTIYDVFQVGTKNGLYYSEDWFLSDLLRKLGFELYVDSSGTCIHAKDSLCYTRGPMEIDKHILVAGFRETPLPETDRLNTWTPCDYKIGTFRL